MIIILTQCYPPRVGGIENLVFNLSYYLSKNEKVVVLADQHNFLAETIFDKKFKKNLIIKRFGGLKYFRKRKKFKELENIIAFNVVKAIISDSWKSIEYPINKIRNKKIPVICLAHGNEIIAKNNTHKKRVVNVLALADKIICNSNFTLKLLQKLNSNLYKAKVIFPGVSNFDTINQEKVEIVLGQPVLLTLARLEKRKGHSEILKAVSNLKKDYPKLLYIIAGEGDEKINLKKLCKELQIEENVKFIGSVNESQKKYIFNKTDLMVMPTKDESHNNSVEGFGIAYIEAALFGIPSIASNVGGTAEAVIHNKTGIIIENLSELSNVLKDLIDDKAKRQMLGKNAKVRAQTELDWEYQIETYISTINSLNK